MTFILLLDTAYPTLGHAYPTLGHGNQKQKQIKSENLSYSSKSSQITLNPQLLGYPQHCDTAILKLGYLTPALELGSPLYNWPVYVVFHQVILMQIYSYSSNIYIYIYRCYVYNIFTINHRWLVIISSNLNLTLRLLF